MKTPYRNTFLMLPIRHWRDLLYQVTPWIIITYFVLRALQNAFYILPFIAPDELYHYELIKLYRHTWSLLTTAEIEAAGYAITTNVPYLYHYLFGKLALLLPDSFALYQYLRVANLFLVTGTVIVFYKVSQLLLPSKKLQLLALVILTNIPSFSFTASGISYDHLVNLVTTSVIYAWIVFHQNKSKTHLLLIFALLALGTLAKISVFPFAFCVFLLVVANILMSRRLSLLLPPYNAWQTVIVSISIVLYLLNAHLYLGNILKFGYLTPSCTQVHSYEQCLRTSFNKPAQYLAEHPPPHVPLENYLARAPFFFVNNLVHIGGHTAHFHTNTEVLIWFLAILMMSIGGLIAVTRQGTSKRKLLYQLLLTLAVYTVAVNYFVYNFYYRSNYFYTEGRYFFPVIAIIIPVLLHSLLIVKSSRIRTILIVLIAGFVLTQDYPFVLTKAYPEWTITWYNINSDKLITELDYLEYHFAW